MASVLKWAVDLSYELITNPCRVLGMLEIYTRADIPLDEAKAKVEKELRKELDY